MKFAVCVAVLLTSSAAAFTPPSMTFAVGKKAPPKKIAGTQAVKSAKAAPKIIASKVKAVAKQVTPKANNLAKKASTKAQVDTKKIAAKAKTDAGRVASAAKGAFPAGKQAFSSVKRAIPSAKQAFSSAKQAFPSTKQAFSSAKQAFPSAKQAFSSAKQALPSAKRAFPSAKQAVSSVKKAAPFKSVARAVSPIKKAASPFRKTASPIRKAIAPIKRAAPKLRSRFSGKSGTIPSTAIPYEDAPAILDGSLVGDRGFDPCFLTSRADSMANYFNKIFNGAVDLDGLSWYREAELMHGRICMVAVLGFIAPGFGTLNGNEWTGFDAYSYKNPLEALTSAPSLALFQIFAFMAILEFRRINIITKAGSNYMPGSSQNWGQGEGRWNPFNFNYTPEQYEEKQLQELKHARLAMIGFLGVVFQAGASGESVVQQWSTAFTAPDYYAKAGYFLPEGI